MSTYDRKAAGHDLATGSDRELPKQDMAEKLIDQHRLEMLGKGVPDDRKKLHSNTADALEAQVRKIAVLESVLAAVKQDEELVIAERDTLRAKMEELEKLEPSYLLTPDGKCYAYEGRPPLSSGHARETLLKLYIVAKPDTVRELSDSEIDALWLFDKQLNIPQIIQRRAIARAAIQAARSAT